MTGEQRERLDLLVEELNREGRCGTRDTLRAALAQIDALAADVERLTKERDHYAEQLGLVYWHVTGGLLSKPYDFKAVESQIDDRLNEFYGKEAAEADARATAAEQRVAELAQRLGIERGFRQQAEARLREVEAERDRWIARAKEAYQFIGSNDETTVETLLAAKEQAEQTAAGLREALEKVGRRLMRVHPGSEPSVEEALEMINDALFALHGQAAREGEK